MSMYNLLHGQNPLSGMLLEVLELNSKYPTGRLRDIYTKEEEGTITIVLYTRNGGGNRSCWEDSEEETPCTCPGCVISKILPTHPNYLRDYDDDFDCTYASIEFSVPEGKEDLVEFLHQISVNKMAPEEKMKGLIRKLQEGDEEDPEVQKALKSLRPVMDSIMEAFEEKGT